MQPPRNLAWLQRTREYLGVLVKDRARYRRALSNTEPDPHHQLGWTSLCNRNERLIPNPAGPGFQCDWKYSSYLHACEYIPSWKGELFERAFAQWPIRFVEGRSASSPQVSFVIAFQGRDRLSQLATVIRSLFGQTEVAIEVVVVDLTPEPLEKELPSGIRYFHIPTSHLTPGWRKSWAFNIGARKALGEVLVFHDGDVCAPDGYARELVNTFQAEKVGAASIQRFLFYLKKSEFPASVTTAVGATEVDYVTQNWKGGTIAVRRKAFFDIGGFDEGFVDWGGEDDEFFERCSHVGHFRFGYIPFVHLWHPPQSLKLQVANPNIHRVLPSRYSLTISQRVVELSARSFGNPSEPDPKLGYKDTV